jgi:hypothetical protein
MDLCCVVEGGGWGRLVRCDWGRRGSILALLDRKNRGIAVVVDDRGVTGSRRLGI